MLLFQHIRWFNYYPRNTTFIYYKYNICVFFGQNDGLANLFARKGMSVLLWFSGEIWQIIMQMIMHVHILFFKHFIPIFQFIHIPLFHSSDCWLLKKAIHNDWCQNKVIMFESYIYSECYSNVDKEHFTSYQQDLFGILLTRLVDTCRSHLYG